MRLNVPTPAARVLFLTLALSARPLAAVAGEATVTVDAERPAGALSPMLYGQFLEYMFEGVKSGLDAELIRDRGFEEAPSAIGLPRHWERYPDDRNDDYGLNFTWDASASLPEKRDPDEGRREH